ncbi:FadR family transcriptional regulator [Thermoanaerobacteraceae bacterium SP2]|nr:FadR family transcriptional regulator [Thermoanaerobacteraceae bacterium SP2]
MYNPIEKKRYYQFVADELRSLINKGVINSGDKLPPERELAVQFNVSRHTIREAVNQLQSEGLLKTIPGRGTFALEPNKLSLMYDFAQNMLRTKDDPEYLLEVRQIIEIQAAALAAERSNEQDLKKIQQSLIKIQKEAQESKVGDISDLEFHLSVVQATHNPVLITIMNAISDLFYRCLKKSSEKKKFDINGPKNFYNDHKRIYDEIKSKNANGAAQAMKKHLDRVKDEYVYHNSTVMGKIAPK